MIFSDVTPYSLKLNWPLYPAQGDSGQEPQKLVSAGNTKKTAKRTRKSRKKRDEKRKKRNVEEGAFFPSSSYFIPVYARIYALKGGLFSSLFNRAHAQSVVLKSVFDHVTLLHPFPFNCDSLSRGDEDHKTQVFVQIKRENHQKLIN